MLPTHPAVVVPVVLVGCEIGPVAQDTTSIDNPRYQIPYDGVTLHVLLIVGIGSVEKASPPNEGMVFAQSAISANGTLEHPWVTRYSMASNRRGGYLNGTTGAVH